jgi:hypothetical protein
VLHFSKYSNPVGMCTLKGHVECELHLNKQMDAHPMAVGCKDLDS